MTPEFEGKDPEEIIVLTFDYSADLALAETLDAGPVVSITTQTGVDAAPANVLNGAIALDGASKKGLQSVKAGLSGCNYRIKVKAATNAGRTLVLAGILPVRDA